MADDIKPFSEKEIRSKIISKINPKIQKSNSPHDKGYIYLEGKNVAKVKIPNSHKRIMHQSKSKFIAESLKLTYQEFNALIDCTLRGNQYYQILKDRIKK